MKFRIRKKHSSFHRVMRMKREHRLRYRWNKGNIRSRTRFVTEGKLIKFKARKVVIFIEKIVDELWKNGDSNYDYR